MRVRAVELNRFSRLPRVFSGCRRSQGHEELLAATETVRTLIRFIPAIKWGHVHAMYASSKSAMIMRARLHAMVSVYGVAAVVGLASERGTAFS